MYKNFRVGGGIVLGLSALVLGLVGCSTATFRNSDNNIKRVSDLDFKVGNINYNLCTSVSDLQDDGQYIFSCYDGTTEKFVSMSDTTASLVTRNKESTNNEISSFSFVLVSENDYNLKVGSTYLAAGSGKNNKFINGTSNSVWSVSFVDNCIKMSNNDKFIYYNKSSNGLFRPYTDKSNDSNAANYFFPRLYKVEATQKAYTVTFETNGGSSVASQSVDTSSEIDLDAATTTKKYANFKGWYLDEELTIPFNKDSYIIESDVTLYAKWATTYTVTFINEGKTFGDVITVEEGSKVSEPAEKPTKASTEIYKYTFKHWSLENDGAAFYFNTPITSVTKLYAVYEESFQDISGTVASLKSNSDITFNYIYENNDYAEIKDTVPSGMTGSGDNKNTEKGSGTYSYSLDSGTYSGTQSTKMSKSGHYIKYSFNEVANDAILIFSVKCNGDNTGGKLTISCLDIDGNPIENGSKIESFDGKKSNTVLELNVDFNGISGIKHIKLEYTKQVSNIGVSPIEISATRGSKTFKSFSNFKLNLGYTFNLAEDPRVVSTGILLTGKEGFALASNKSASLPEESYVAKFENKLKTEDYYIAVKFTNDEVKANYTRSIYVIPYVKTSTEYVYGTTYTTSIEKEVAKIDEEGIRDMFAAYVA